MNRYQFCICAIYYILMFLLPHKKVFANVITLLKAFVLYFVIFIAFDRWLTGVYIKVGLSAPNQLRDPVELCICLLKMQFTGCAGEKSEGSW